MITPNTTLPGPDDPSAMRLADFFKDIYLPQRLMGRSPATVVDYTVIMRKFGRWLARPAVLADLNDSTVGLYLAWLFQKEKKKPPTCNHHRQCLLALANFAKRRKLLGEVFDIDKMREFKRVPVCWSLEEFGRILQAAGRTPGIIPRQRGGGKGARIVLDTRRADDGWPRYSVRYHDKSDNVRTKIAASHRAAKRLRRKLTREADGIPARLWWPALLLFAFDTGLRISAALSIRWQDLDLADRWVLVPAEFQKQGADQRFRLHGDTVEAIAKLQPFGLDCVFHWPRARSVLFRHLGKVLVAAGFAAPGRLDKFHKIRKTSATYLANECGKAAACDHLGHSSMSVTSRYLDPRFIKRIQASEVLPRPVLPTE